MMIMIMTMTWTVDSKDSSFLKNSPAYVCAYTYAGNISLYFTVFTVHCPQIKQTQVVCPFNTDTDNTDDFQEMSPAYVHAYTYAGDFSLK